MKYCSDCGAPVEFGFRPMRHCRAMSAAVRRDPLSESEAGDRLCGRASGPYPALPSRAIEPRSGLWTLPAGFMENGESTAEATARGAVEEACAVVAIDALFALVSMPHIDQVHLFYRARLPEPVHSPGPKAWKRCCWQRKTSRGRQWPFAASPFVCSATLPIARPDTSACTKPSWGTPPARPQEAELHRQRFVKIPATRAVRQGDAGLPRLHRGQRLF